MKHLSYVTSLLLLLSPYAVDAKSQKTGLKRFREAQVDQSVLPFKSSVWTRDFTSLAATEQTYNVYNFTYPTFANPTAGSYLVNTSALPNVSIQFQNSWAGRINANSTPGNISYFFWYFPSSKTGGSQKLSIWLNGGPGCSSLEGALQENGPLDIAPGSATAALNPWAWTAVSDMLYVEQPAGVGYSTGNQSDLVSETPLADDFYKWLQAFFGVFSELRQKDLYVTGESYAGMYVPYIAQRILEGPVTGNSSDVVNLKGIMVNDGVYSDFVTSEDIPISRFITRNADILGYNASLVAEFQNASKACGYEAILDNITYPQQGGQIKLPFTSDQLYANDTLANECDLWDRFYNISSEINPCFNIYRITDKCPTPTDIIGDGSYLGRTEVQKALHVLPANGTAYPWMECSANDPFVNNTDNSPPSEVILPGILSKIPVLLWQGLLDGILLPEGNNITIQNMTWNGAQGFQSPINSSLVVDGRRAGTWHAERNLTFIFVEGAGHMIPEDQPEVALAVFEAFITNASIGNGTLSANGVNKTGTITGTAKGSGAGVSGSSGGAQPKSAASALGLDLRIALLGSMLAIGLTSISC